MFFEKDLVKAREDVEKHIGSKVRIRYNSGKRKQRIKDGVIISTYKSIFLINVEIDKDTTTNATYTYKDLLTKNVIITVV